MRRVGRRRRRRGKRRGKGKRKKKKKKKQQQQQQLKEKEKKIKFLPLVTAWMDLEKTMLSETSQRKTNTIGFHSYVESNEQTKLTSKTETNS